MADNDHKAILAALPLIREARCEIARVDLRLAPVHAAPERKQIRETLEYLEEQLRAAAVLLEQGVS